MSEYFKTLEMPPSLNSECVLAFWKGHNWMTVAGRDVVNNPNMYPYWMDLPKPPKSECEEAFEYHCLHLPMIEIGALDHRYKEGFFAAWKLAKGEK